MYDLEERALKFAMAIREYINSQQRDPYLLDDHRQLIRSSASIGANYIEANEALSPKDFIHRIKIAKKEAKETIFWLKILRTEQKYIQEATEIMKILGAILENFKGKV